MGPCIRHNFAPSPLLPSLPPYLRSLGFRALLDCHDVWKCLVSFRTFFSAIYRSSFFLLPLPFLFPAPLALATTYVSYSFCMAAVKNWVLIMGKAWEWNLDQL